MKKQLLAFAAAAALTVSFARAQIIPVSNYSFEATVVASGSSSFGSPPSWTHSSNAAQFGTNNPSPSLGAFQDGSNVAFLGITGTGTAAPANPLAYLQQTLTTTFQADTVYTLTVAAGNFLGGSDNLSNTYVSLLAGSTSLAQSTPYFAGVGATAPLKDTTLTFDTTTDPSIVGQAITIQLDFYSTNPFLRNAYFDNVRLDAVSAVPEPSTCALLLCSLSILVWTIRRRSIALS